MLWTELDADRRSYNRVRYCEAAIIGSTPTLLLADDTGVHSKTPWGREIRIHFLTGGSLMHGRIISRILLSATFLASVVIGANVTAQTAPSAPGQARGSQNHAAVEQNPACQKIINECKNLGFIQGQWKKDNGLWKDCFDPVVKGGGSATRDGKPISVPVSASEIQSCRAAESHHKAAQ
jgi:hypothetical protein